MKTKKPTLSQASSYKTAAGAVKMRETNALKSSTLKINPIRIEQDELIEEDERVKLLREWKLAQLREQEEEERRREERDAN